MEGLSESNIRYCKRFYLLYCDVIENLLQVVEDLTAAFPDDKRYSDRNLRILKRFAEAYPDFPILQVPLAKLIEKWRF